MFWETIDIERRARGLRRPDFMLGDFNVTEDNIDRAPAHQCYDKDLQTSFYLFKLGVLILES